MNKLQHYGRTLPTIGQSINDDNYLLLDDFELRERSYRQTIKRDAIESGMTFDNDFTFDNWSDN